MVKASDIEVVLNNDEVAQITPELADNWEITDEIARSKAAFQGILLKYGYADSALLNPTGLHIGPVQWTGEAPTGVTAIETWSATAICPALSKEVFKRAICEGFLSDFTPLPDSAPGIVRTAWEGLNHIALMDLATKFGITQAVIHHAMFLGECIGKTRISVVEPVLQKKINSDDGIRKAAVSKKQNTRDAWDIIKPYGQAVKRRNPHWKDDLVWQKVLEEWDDHDELADLSRDYFEIKYNKKPYPKISTLKKKIRLSK
jgi:hypothetical protein